jgi:hypothetical protein
VVTSSCSLRASSSAAFASATSRAYRAGKKNYLILISFIHYSFVYAGPLLLQATSSGAVHEHLVAFFLAFQPSEQFNSLTSYKTHNFKVKY